MFKVSLVDSPKKVIGDLRKAKKPWIRPETLEIIEQRRAAKHRYDLKAYMSLTAVHRQVLRRDKQLWTDKISTQAGSLQRCLYRLLSAVNIRPKNLGFITRH